MWAANFRTSDSHVVYSGVVLRTVFRTLVEMTTDIHNRVVVADVSVVVAYVGQIVATAVWDTDTTDGSTVDSFHMSNRTRLMGYRRYFQSISVLVHFELVATP